jgi:hypothetical protein
MNAITGKAIEAYVTERLKNESLFQIDVHDFCSMFELKKPFYEDMIKYMRAANVSFVIDAPWKFHFSPNEAAWFIQFSRPT